MKIAGTTNRLLMRTVRFVCTRCGSQDFRVMESKVSAIRQMCAVCISPDTKALYSLGLHRIDEHW